MCIFVHVCSRLCFFVHVFQVENPSETTMGELTICGEKIFSKYMLAYFDALVEVSPWFENLKVAEENCEVEQNQQALLAEHEKHRAKFVEAVKEKLEYPE